MAVQTDNLHRLGMIDRPWVGSKGGGWLSKLRLWSMVTASGKSLGAFGGCPLQPGKGTFDADIILLM